MNHITENILRNCEKGISLFTFTDDALITARKEALREIHKYELDRELARRKKPIKPVTTSGVTHVRRKNRCPTKRDLK